jgi:cytochrome subunit of sulfide dehydrogenase
MKNIHYRHNAVMLLLFTSATWFSCKKDVQPIVQSAVTTSNDASDLAIINLPGRTLAANCFQCHGTNGHAQELGIAGMSSSEIINEINDMKNENPGDNIMNVHAIAYTDAEIKLIADFFSKQ